MSDKFFPDTNIFVCPFDKTDPRQDKTREEPVMPIEQMKISPSPQSMQEEEARRKEQALLPDIESRLTKMGLDGIRRGVQQGSRDIRRGWF